MKILAITQPDPPAELIRKALGPETYDKIIWAVCRPPHLPGVGAPDFGLIHALLEKEKPDLIICFGALIQDALAKDFQGYGRLLPCASLPDLSGLDRDAERIRGELNKPPEQTTNEPKYEDADSDPPF